MLLLLAYQTIERVCYAKNPEQCSDYSKYFTNFSEWPNYCGFSELIELRSQPDEPFDLSKANNTEVLTITSGTTMNISISNLGRIPSLYLYDSNVTFYTDQITTSNLYLSKTLLSNTLNKSFHFLGKLETDVYSFASIGDSIFKRAYLKIDADEIMEDWDFNMSKNLDIEFVGNKDLLVYGIGQTIIIQINNITMKITTIDFDNSIRINLLSWCTMEYWGVGVRKSTLRVTNHGKLILHDTSGIQYEGSGQVEIDSYHIDGINGIIGKMTLTEKVEDVIDINNVDELEVEGHKVISYYHRMDGTASSKTTLNGKDSEYILKLYGYLFIDGDAKYSIREYIHYGYEFQLPRLLYHNDTYIEENEHIKPFNYNPMNIKKEFEADVTPILHYKYFKYYPHKNETRTILTIPTAKDCKKWKVDFQGFEKKGRFLDYEYEALCEGNNLSIKTTQVGNSVYDKICIGGFECLRHDDYFRIVDHGENITQYLNPYSKDFHIITAYDGTIKIDLSGMKGISLTLEGGGSVEISGAKPSTFVNFTTIDCAVTFVDVKQKLKVENLVALGKIDFNCFNLKDTNVESIYRDDLINFPMKSLVINPHNLFIDNVLISNNIIILSETYRNLTVVIFDNIKLNCLKIDAKEFNLYFIDEHPMTLNISTNAKIKFINKIPDGYNGLRILKFNGLELNGGTLVEPLYLTNQSISVNTDSTIEHMIASGYSFEIRGDEKLTINDLEASNNRINIEGSPNIEVKNLQIKKYLNASGVSMSSVSVGEGRDSYVGKVTKKINYETSLHHPGTIYIEEPEERDIYVNVTLDNRWRKENIEMLFEKSPRSMIEIACGIDGDVKCSKWRGEVNGIEEGKYEIGCFGRCFGLYHKEIPKPTPSLYPTPSASPYPSASPSLYPTSSPSPSLYPTHSASPSLFPTPSPSQSPSQSPFPTVSASPSLYPTSSPSPSPPQSPSPSPSHSLPPSKSASSSPNPTTTKSASQSHKPDNAKQEVIIIASSASGGFVFIIIIIVVVVCVINKKKRKESSELSSLSESLITTRL